MGVLGRVTRVKGVNKRQPNLVWITDFRLQNQATKLKDRVLIYQPAPLARFQYDPQCPQISGILQRRCFIQPRGNALPLVQQRDRLVVV